jgi:hypothetical protein
MPHVGQLSPPAARGRCQARQFQGGKPRESELSGGEMSRTSGVEKTFLLGLDAVSLDNSDLFVRDLFVGYLRPGIA